MTKNHLLSGANILWVIIIFILCAMPSEDIPDPGLNIPHLDKVVHFGMFFVMSLLICYRYENQKRQNLKYIYALAIGISVVYGGSIEILQHCFFNRGGDIWDLLADIAGGVAGCMSYPAVKKLEARFLKGKRTSKP